MRSVYLLTMPAEDLINFVKDVAATGEVSARHILILSHLRPVTRPIVDDFLAVQSSQGSTLFSYRVKGIIGDLFQVELVNHFRYGLRVPHYSRRMTAHEAAEWMCFHETASFRMVVHRLEIPGDPRFGNGMKFHHTYDPLDVWAAAIMTRTQQFRLNIIDQREAVLQKKETLPEMKIQSMSVELNQSSEHP